MMYEIDWTKVMSRVVGIILLSLAISIFTVLGCPDRYDFVGTWVSISGIGISLLLSALMFFIERRSGGPPTA